MKKRLTLTAVLALLLASCTMQRLTRSESQHLRTEVACADEHPVIAKKLTANNSIKPLLQLPESEKSFAGSLKIAANSQSARAILKHHSPWINKIPLQAFVIQGDTLKNNSVKKKPATIEGYDLLAIIASGSLVVALGLIIAAIILSDTLSDIVLVGFSAASLVLIFASVILGIIAITQIGTSKPKVKGLVFAVLPVALFFVLLLLLIASLG